MIDVEMGNNTMAKLCGLHTKKYILHPLQNSFNIALVLFLCPEPMEKIIQLSESTKNKILTAEGVLLLLCVIVPSVNLLCQVRRSRIMGSSTSLCTTKQCFQYVSLMVMPSCTLSRMCLIRSHNMQLVGSWW